MDTIVGLAPERRQPDQRRRDPRRGSSAELMGLHVAAAHRRVGKVVGVNVAEESLVTTDLVIAGPRFLLWQERFAVAVSMIERVDWPSRTVQLLPNWQPLALPGEKRSSIARALLVLSGAALIGVALAAYLRS